MNHRKQNKLKAVIIATINASFDSSTTGKHLFESNPEKFQR